MNHTIAYLVSMVVMSVVLMLHLLPTWPSVLLTLSAAFGFTYGIQNVLLAVVPATLFGRENLPQVFGYEIFFIGVGALIGPPIVGE